MDKSGGVNSNSSFILSEGRRSFSRPLLTSEEQLNGRNIIYPEEDAVGGKESLFFRDKVRSADFVLVWDKLQARSLDGQNVAKRAVFEQNLEREGLELEYEKPISGLLFVKIHAPAEVLRRYAEILKLRLPMKEELCTIHKASKNNFLLHATSYLSQRIPELQGIHDRTNTFVGSYRNLTDRILHPYRVDEKLFPPKSKRFTAIYSRDKEYLFDINAPGFFSSAIRSRIVQFILDRQRFSEAEHQDFAFGIERLIAENAYLAAYPLHDGELDDPTSLRCLLFTEWASVSKLLKYQPVDYIKEYFGVKIALYFAWLGFYTHMLFPAAFVGLICFIYGCFTLHSNVPSKDICDNDSGIMMCPLCDYFCDYWDLKETCLHAKVTYLIDNPTTVFFALFMSFWAAIFLELWKRYSAEMTHRWDLTGFDMTEEHPRPQYLARLAHVKRQHINVVTNTLEPYVPFWRMRFPATMLSFSIVVLLVAMAVVAVLGVVLYRMSVLAALSVYGDSVITSNAILFTTATAASINLCCIVVFNWIYTYLAEYLTELELLRTQTEFDDSLTLKIYLLQFVNYYASIFYIAFFKGKFIGYPGNYNRFFNFRQEECGPGGCLMELCIQLSIIMVGKQAMNTLLEMVFPFIYKWLNLKWLRTSLRGKTSVRDTMRWVRDLRLLEWGPRGLFAEYLEMVLQYGFVTIFVAAFPLAPLFALINNMFEMRLDAKKLLTFYRRPVTQRVRDIGVWFKILSSVGKLAVITNGFIIAFTSEFIPRLVYRFHMTDDHGLHGYLNHSLAYFNVSALGKSAPHVTKYDLTFCRYPAYREPPWAPDPHAYTNMYWHVLAARLAFVVVFENFVFLVMLAVKWCVPDVPGHLRDQIRREAYLTNEIIIKQEMMRVRRAERTPTPMREDAVPTFTNLVNGKTVTAKEMQIDGAQVSSL